jgi:DNA-binding transcriptional regulator YiaG
MAETPQSRTLQRALEMVGGEQHELAAALGVNSDELATWLVGNSTPPTNIYIAALEIVARHAIQKRR